MKACQVSADIRHAPQVGAPPCLALLAQCERQVCVDRPLVELVQHDGAHASQRRVLRRVPSSLTMLQAPPRASAGARQALSSGKG